MVVWPVVPRTVTLGGPFPLDFSFSRGFYYGWKKNEWANLFTFCGSAGIFQMLPSHPYQMPSLCVEQLGEPIRARGKWGTDTLFLQILEAQRDMHRLVCGGAEERGLSGPALPSQRGWVGTGSGGSQGEVEAQWKCQASGKMTSSLVLPLEYKVHTLASPLCCADSCRSSCLPALCYSFHSAGHGSGGLAG